MSPRSTAALAIVVFATLASPASIGSASPRAAAGFQPTRSKATAYRVNARHNAIQTDHLGLPLHLLWKRRLPHPGYALIANGSVYVVTVNRNGAALRALDERTGRGRWARTLGAASRAWATYGDHRVFVLHEVTGNPSTGRLQAFRAADGKPLWGVTISSEPFFDTAPTAAGRQVVVEGAGEGSVIYAFRALDGDAEWQRPIDEGYDALPGFTKTHVIVNYPFGDTYALSRRTGAVDWKYRSTSGADVEDETAAIVGSRIFLQDPGKILDAGTGRVLGSFDSQYAVTATHGLLFTIRWSLNNTSRSRVVAVPASGGNPEWTFFGDHGIVFEILDGPYLFAASSAESHLYALLPTTGTLAWKTDLPGHITSLTAGGGLLLVSSFHALRAYA